MSAMKTALLAFLAFSFALAGAESPASFQNIPEGESVVVAYKSQGCFHQSSYKLEFAKAGTTTVKVSQFAEEERPAAGAKPESELVRFGTITLTDTDLAGLDLLLAFYRGPPPGQGCTNVDKIKIFWKKAGMTQATESFTDSSCATYKMKELTLFSTLVQRASVEENK